MVLIKDQFIDGKPEWEDTLYNLLEGAGKVWVIMQGLSELAPERPVENVSIQFLNQSGQLISQLDAPLALLVSPDKLKEGEFTTRYALEVLPKGVGEPSRLIAVVYNPVTMQRVAFKGLGDYLELWSKGQGE